MRNNVLFFLAGVILALFLLRGCVDGGVVTQVKYIPGDSVPYVVYKAKPIPYKVTYKDTIVSFDTIYEDGLPTYVVEPVDSARILREFYATATYKDTVKNDSSALIVINEGITRNRVEKREVIFQNRRATQVVELRKKAIVLGLGANYTGLDVSVGYRKDKDVLSLTYGTQGVGVRYQRELTLK